MRRTRSRDESCDETKQTEEEAGRGDPTGENSSRGSWETASGFGGLRLEGIVGMIEDSDGEGDISLEPGVGNRGEVSGDMAGGEAEKLDGASGKNEGAADMVDSWSSRNSDVEVCKQSERTVKAVNRETFMVTVCVSLLLWECLWETLRGEKDEKLEKKNVYSYRGGKRQDLWVWLWTSGLGQSTWNMDLSGFDLCRSVCMFWYCE